MIKSKEEILNLQSDMSYYFKVKKFLPNHFNLYSPIEKDDPDRIHFTQIFNKYQGDKINDHQLRKLKHQLELQPKESRAIGVMLGMAINDSLGASTQGLKYLKQGHNIIKQGFSDIHKAISNDRLNPRSLKVGIWTDDASMGLAMGYGLIQTNYQFDPIKTRQMFHLWWFHGLGNGGRQHSIGLGGNIQISVKEFYHHPTKKYVSKGLQDNNGNGSLMRLSPIPIIFNDNIEQASSAATNQSLTTHNGLQAKQCCRLLTEIIVNLIQRKNVNNWENIIINTCDNFKTQVKSVQYLAKGLKETKEIFEEQNKKYPNFYKFNKTLKDRNWNWRQESFIYSPTRTNLNPRYIGSYCMDALAMALNVVLFTNSYKQCALRIANFGGDCDSVGAIAGQITGAIFGVNQEMLKFYMQMHDFQSQRYQAFLMGYKLFHKGVVKHPKTQYLKERISCNKSQSGMEQQNDSLKYSATHQ